MLGVVLVAAPRFNRQDAMVGQWTGGKDGANLDSAEYEQLVRFIRHEVPKEGLEAPFCYRPIVPLIASVLPLQPNTSMNVVNAALLLLSLLILHNILSLPGVQPWKRLLGDGLFVFSFPLFYYGTIGGVDPGALFILTIGLWAILQDRPVATLAIIAIGVLVKETSVLLIPVWLTRLLLQGKPLRHVVSYGACAATSVILASWAIRTAAPESTYVWVPSLKRLIFNSTRSRSWVSMLLSFGAPGVLCLLALARSKPWRETDERTFLWPLAMGFAGALGLTALAWMTAHADGRFMWLSYPFTIPLAMKYGLRGKS